MSGGLVFWFWLLGIFSGGGLGGRGLGFVLVF